MDSKNTNDNQRQLRCICLVAGVSIWVAYLLISYMDNPEIFLIALSLIFIAIFLVPGLWRRITARRVIYYAIAACFIFLVSISTQTRIHIMNQANKDLDVYVIDLEFHKKWSHRLYAGENWSKLLSLADVNRKSDRNRYLLLAITRDGHIFHHARLKTRDLKNGSPIILQHKPDNETSSSDINDPQEIWHIKHNGKGSVYAGFSPDGKLLACTEGNVIEIYDWKNQKLISVLKAGETEKIVSNSN